MRKVAFLALALFLVALFSGSQASSVELVDNYCGVVDCVAVLKVVPDKDISTPSKQNWDYRFDYYIEKGNIKALKYEVGLESKEPIYDNKEVCRFEDVPDLNKGGTKRTEICEFAPDYTRIIGYKTSVEWQDGFFGKGMDSGRVYYVRITGEKAPPYLGEFRADWVMTFDKVEYRRWAWWNAAWTYKRPIFLNPVDIDKNTTIEIPIDFTDANFSGKFLASLNDVRVVDENNNVEIDRDCRAGASGACWFRMPFPMKSGQTAAQIATYYIYYDNSGAGAPADQNVERTWVDDFESVGLGGWVERDPETVQDTSIWKFNATSMKSNSDSQYKLITTIGAQADNNSDYNYTGWIRGEDVDDTTVSFSIRAGTENLCDVGIKSVYGGTFYLEGASAVDTGVTATDNTWYKVALHLGHSNNLCHATFYASDGKTRLASAKVVSGNGGGNGSTATRMYTQAEASAVDDVWFDNLYNKPALTGTGFGAEEQSAAAATADLNIWRVDGYDISGQFPTFSYDIDGNLTIDFNVWNSDNNAMTVDINYSTSPTQGGGTVIVNDLNLSSFVCTNAQGWSVNDSNCSWDWNISGISDNNYYILVDMNGGGAATEVFEALGKTFHVQSPSLKLRVFDENTGVPLVSATVNFNGVDYAVGADGYVSISTAGLTAGSYTATISEDGNYPARLFEIDVNASMEVNDINVAMLHDNNGQTVTFKFYDTDQTTLLSNKKIYLLNDDNTASIRTTTATGTTSFFLDPDDNYVFKIIRSSTDVVDYYPTRLTILTPKDEWSKALISPFDITGSQLASQEWLGLTASQGMNILSNTIGYYEFDVNGGLLYYSRTYLINLQGNPTTYTLQPYLTKVADSGDFIFYVKNATTLSAIADVEIRIERTIAGEGTQEVQSIETDYAGTASIALLYDTEYEVFFYYEDELVHTATIRPTTASTSYQVLLDLTSLISDVVRVGNLIVDFRPRFGSLPLTDANIGDINVGVTLENKTLSTMDITIKDNNGYVFDTNSFVGPWTDGNWVYYLVNLTDFNVWNNLIVQVDVNSVDGNRFTKTFTYMIISARRRQYNLFERLTLFAADYDETVTAFIAIFLTILAVGGLAAGSVLPTSPSVLAFVSIGMLLAFHAIGFIGLPIIGFAAFFVVLIIMIESLGRMTR